jgi:hypothetical protein
VTDELAYGMLARVSRSSLVLLLTLGGCHQAPPTAGSAPGPSAVPAPSDMHPPDAAVPAPSAPPSASAAAASLPSARPETGDELLDESRLVDQAGRALPQTEAQPTAASPACRRRAELLLRAIREDRPELARPAFFPVIAYREVKAIERPERDWQYRLWRNFERDVHEYSKELRLAGPEAKLVGLVVPEGRARWMKPGSEGNKLGYWRVLRPQLRYLDAQGREHALEVTSLISWRGEWYVVHLHGFK